MRILAYGMLIFGFLLICFYQFEIRPIAQAVVVAQCDKIPKQEFYKVEDVIKTVRDAAVDMADHVPSFLIGGLLMLGGGVVLDRSVRRKRVSTSLRA
jgi:LPXTG cell wall anchor motif